MKPHDQLMALLEWGSVMQDSVHSPAYWAKCRRDVMKMPEDALASTIMVLAQSTAGERQMTPDQVLDMVRSGASPKALVDYSHLPRAMRVTALRKAALTLELVAKAESAGATNHDEWAVNQHIQTVIAASLRKKADYIESASDFTDNG